MGQPVYFLVCLAILNLFQGFLRGGAALPGSVRPPSASPTRHTSPKSEQSRCIVHHTLPAINNTISLPALLYNFAEPQFCTRLFSVIFFLFIPSIRLGK